MGDADVAQNEMENDEISVLLDEALEEVDQDMNRLFSFINHLYEQASFATAQAITGIKLRRCFIALNVCLIPLILAIGTAYVFAGLKISRALQSGLEAFVMILMYVSVGIGLPFYAMSLWEAYFTKSKPEDLLPRSKRDRRNVDSHDAEEENDAILQVIEESLQTIGQFRALSRAQQRVTSVYSRVEAGGSDSEEELVREDSVVSTGFSTETPAKFNNNEVKSANPQIIDLDFFDCIEDDDSHFSCSETPQEYKDEHINLEFTSGNCGGHPSVSSDVGEILKPILKKQSKLLVVKASRSRGLRNITIKDVGDSNETRLEKDNCDRSYLETTFGL